MKKKRDGEGGSQNGQAKIPIYSITYERGHTTIYARHTVNNTEAFLQSESSSKVLVFTSKILFSDFL